MFNQLLKLYKKHSEKTPLEDFTTEVFVGILNLEEEIKNSFIVDFLKLPAKDYNIKTQVRYELEKDINCIVDIVVQNENYLCLIENKVNSKEGYRQIERYGKVLDTFIKDGFETKLFYCTKYFDEKTYVEHNFTQFRWFQIAKFLKKFQSVSIVNDFINFLKKNNMAQELTFNAKDFITFENIQNLINITIGYLDRMKPIFENTFKTSTKIIDGKTTSQIMQHNRLIYAYKDIVPGNGWSEIKYGFQLQTPTIYVGIWIDKANLTFNEFKDFATNNLEHFIVEVKSNGVSVELKKDISVFLNNENADYEITNWYKEAFEKFKLVIKETPQFNWNINVG